jgi:hypothetical protein
MRRVAAAAVALLSMIMLPMPARAEPAPEPFVMAPCVQASLASVTYDPDSTSMVLNGTAVQCAPVVEHAGFQVALYLPRSLVGTTYAWTVRRFAGPVEGEVHPFGIRLREAGRQTYGVCLMSATVTGQELGGHRVACGLVVQANPQTDPPTATLTPLATSDPLVAKMALPYPTAPPNSPDGTIDDICGTCF